MNSYLGIIIENSLGSRWSDSPLQVMASKQIGSWTYMLVSAEDAELDSQIHWLQENMVTDEGWYAHYFRNDQMIVVYTDEVFHTTLNPDTWHSAIEHGTRKGIPVDQLNFSPNTDDEATRFFARAILPQV